MKYGLTDQQIKIIVAMISVYSEVDAAILFGSRAMGNYKKTSDVDIALKGNNLDIFLTTSIKCHLEEGTSIPYFFDVVDYEKITNEKLREHIDKFGKVIYDKK